MSVRPSTIERAYQLAASDLCQSFTQIMRALSREGFADVRAQLDGSAIRASLKAVLDKRKRNTS